MSEDYDEEERVFRDALRQAADAEDFEPLAPPRVRPAGRRFTWPGAVAGVAAVAAVVLLGVFVLPRMGGGMTAGSAAAPAASMAASDAAEAAPSAASAESSGPQEGVTPASVPVEGTGSSAQAGGTADLGDPLPGFRWEVSGQVAVQVPDSWERGYAPAADWCADPDDDPSVHPAGPFVGQPRESLRFILCEGTVPADRLAMNLQFWTSGQQGPELPSPWSYETVGVGEVTVAVASDGSQPELVRRILDTARQAP